MQSGEGLGAIYQFFKDLTTGKMQIDGKENIPFSLFISTMRRRKIIQSMQGLTEEDKKEGEKILINYKKQLAEQRAREHLEKNEYNSKKGQSEAKSSSSAMGGTKYSKKSNKDENDAMKLVSQKMQEISNFQGEPPEPEILMDILMKKNI